MREPVMAVTHRSYSKAPDLQISRARSFVDDDAARARSRASIRPARRSTIRRGPIIPIVLFTGGDDVSRLVDLTGEVVARVEISRASRSPSSIRRSSAARADMSSSRWRARRAREPISRPADVQTRIRKTVGEVDWNGAPLWSFGTIRAGRPRASASRHRPPAERQHAGARQYLLSSARLRRAAGAGRRRL